MADLLTVEQAAKQCGVSARTLRRANKAGKLHFCRLGQGPKTDRIRPQDLDAFIESCQSRNGRTEAIRYLSPSPVASRLESLIGDGRTRTRAKSKDASSPKPATLRLVVNRTEPLRTR